jgi:hypothetical protein
MEQAEAQKQKIKEIIVICFIKKAPDLGAFFLVNHDF